jgi:hypothetical protein
MLNILIKLLPSETRSMVLLAQTLFKNLDTKEERKRVIDYALSIFSKTKDGKIEAQNWSKLGGKDYLGITTGRDNSKSTK